MENLIKPGDKFTETKNGKHSMEYETVSVINGVVTAVNVYGVKGEFLAEDIIRGGNSLYSYTRQ